VDLDRLRACSVADLVTTAQQLSALHSAVHAALLDVLTVIDEREAWRSDGAGSTEDWISFRLGVTHRTAHAWTETARSLTGLPHLAQAFADGSLSFDKTRAAAQVATPEDDATVAEQARSVDAVRLEMAARRVRGVAREESIRRHSERHLALRRSRDLGGVRLWGFLPDVEGETVMKAIERLAEDAVKDPDTGTYPSYDRRCADALVEMASMALAGEQPKHGARAMVVAHMEVGPDAGALSGELEGEVPISDETALRISCDASVETVIESNGKPVGVGRTRRTPSPSMRRQLKRRDVGCRFPGCHRMALTDSHHILHWINDGMTQPDNLILLCYFHHRLVHEGGWCVRGDAEARIEFVKPNGEVLASAPPALQPALKQRVLGPLLE
jgi:hypothetical protein